MPNILENKYYLEALTYTVESIDGEIMHHEEDNNYFKKTYYHPERPDDAIEICYIKSSGELVSIRFYHKNKLHSDTGPAIVMFGYNYFYKKLENYKHGIRDGYNGTFIEPDFHYNINGTIVEMIMYFKGQICCTDAYAHVQWLIDRKVMKAFLNGQLHRSDDFACVSVNVAKQMLRRENWVNGVNTSTETRSAVIEHTFVSTNKDYTGGFEYDPWNTRVEPIFFVHDAKITKIMRMFMYALSYAEEKLDGKLHSYSVERPAIVYYNVKSTGKLLRFHYKNGKINDMFGENGEVEYYLNGQLKFSIPYSDGLRHCTNKPAEYYDVHGNLIETIWYENGEVHNENLPAIHRYKKGKLVDVQWCIHNKIVIETAHHKNFIKKQLKLLELEGTEMQTLNEYKAR